MATRCVQRAAPSGTLLWRHVCGPRQSVLLPSNALLSRASGDTVLMSTWR